MYLFSVYIGTEVSFHFGASLMITPHYYYIYLIVLFVIRIKDWEDSNDLLEKMCKRMGRLGKGGEPDIKVIYYYIEEFRLPNI